MELAHRNKALKCPKCGAETPEDSAFCQECGAKIERNNNLVPQGDDASWTVGQWIAFIVFVMATVLIVLVILDI